MTTSPDIDLITNTRAQGLKPSQLPALILKLCVYGSSAHITDNKKRRTRIKGIERMTTVVKQARSYYQFHEFGVDHRGATSHGEGTGVIMAMNYNGAQYDRRVAYKIFETNNQRIDFNCQYCTYLHRRVST